MIQNEESLKINNQFSDKSKPKTKLDIRLNKENTNSVIMKN